MTTLVVYSDVSDGHIASYDGFDDEFDGYPGTYANARAGTGTLTAYTTQTSGSVGQLYTGNYFAQYSCDEGFLSFDTSSVGAGSTVSAATLNLTSNGDFSTTDFDLQARLRDWGATLETGDYVAGASLSALTLLASRNTSGGWTTGTGYDLTSEAGFPGAIVKTGSTRMLLCSSRTVSGTAPTGNEFISVRFGDYAGTTSDPKLTVEYSAGGGGAQSIGALALVDASGTVYAPTLAPQPVTVTVGLVDASRAVYAPSALPQPVTVTVPLVDGAPAVYAPTVAPQPVTATLGLIDGGATAYAPSLQGGAATIPPVGGRRQQPPARPSTAAAALPLISSIPVVHAIAVDEDDDDIAIGLLLGVVA